MHLLKEFVKKIIGKKKSYSKGNLDDTLQKYLNYSNGFFIEAGANNGLTQSNTKYLEKYLKWEGLLIEPIPQLAKKCKINRPGCKVENYALVSKDFEDEEVVMHYADLMSLVKGGLKNVEDEKKHIDLACDIQQIESYEIRVKATTITNLLDKYRPDKIDFFSLDVEGYELEVLKGLDFSRYRPKFLLVEARCKSDDLDNFLLDIYNSHGYISEHDVLYELK